MTAHVIDPADPTSTPTSVLAAFRDDPHGTLDVHPRPDGRPHPIHGPRWEFTAGTRTARFHPAAALYFRDATEVRFRTATTGPHPQHCIGGQWNQHGADLILENQNNIDLTTTVKDGDLWIVNVWPDTLDPEQAPPPQSERVRLHVDLINGCTRIAGAPGGGSFRGLDLTGSTYGPEILCATDATIYHAQIDLLAWATNRPLDPLRLDNVSLHGTDVTFRVERPTRRLGYWSPRGHWSTGEPDGHQCRSFNLSVTHPHEQPFRFYGPLADLPPFRFTDSRTQNPVAIRCNDADLAPAETAQ